MSIQALIDHTLHLGDDALILGHRNSEWTGHGPILEQDIALSNIALDLIGQARNFYQFAAERINAEAGAGSAVGRGAEIGLRAIILPPKAEGRQRSDGWTEDTLAYLRDVWDFRNCLLVEQANGDWAKTVLRQFFFSAYQYYFYGELRNCREKTLAAIAEKSLKEVTYHLRWSSEWVVRLGDGTEESHSRMEKAMGDLWKYTGELFLPAEYEQALAPEELTVDLALIRPFWEARVQEVLTMAQLTYQEGVWMQTGGKQGKHTEQLGYLLAEMQFLQRAYPDCEW
jgi:ring-1,2-phenylacetyl-CoA epoxidase subunit PaaC